VLGALARGLRPMVTLHHFTHPLWFHRRGGWTAEGAVGLFARYVRTVAPLLADVRHVCTINEPNLLAVLPALLDGRAAFGESGLPAPDPATADALVLAHHAARAELRTHAPLALVGWTVACQSFEAEPGAEPVCAEVAYSRETQFLEVSRDDDWVGVQSYTRNRVGVRGILPPPADAPLTLTGWEVYPAALGAAVRTAAAVSGVPVIVTENGIATADDEQRIAYTAAALDALNDAMADGVDVRGYFHWSLLDNYEWGRWAPTFGLIAVDRTTFVRTAKPSLSWLGTHAPRPTEKELNHAP
jgi:beta-glucosidase